MNFLMDIFFVALTVVCLVGVKVKRKGIFEDFLSLDNANTLKGIFCVTVIFHHLAQRTQGGLIFPEYQSAGYLAVSVFFFLSGYGLMTSYLSKGERYRDNFLKIRLPSVLLPFIVIVSLYLLFFVFVEGKGWNYLYEKLIWESNSWYVIAILFLYLFFFLSMVFMKTKGKIVVMMFFGSFIYCALCMTFIKDQAWWYNSCLALNLGLIFAAYKEKLSEMISTHWPFTLVSALILFYICFTLAEPLWDVQPDYTFIAQGAAVLFCLIIAVVAMKVKFKNPVLSFLGKISYELYLVHGLVILFIRSSVLNIHSNLLFSAIVLFGGIALAYPLHLLFDLILKKYRKLVLSPQKAH